VFSRKVKTEGDQIPGVPVISGVQVFWLPRQQSEIVLENRQLEGSILAVGFDA